MSEEIHRALRFWWFGPWNRPGHYLHDTNGRTPWTNETPLSGYHKLDSCLQPRRHKRTGAIVFTAQDRDLDQSRTLHYASEELPQGQFLRHLVLGCTVIAWWDRTQGDTRGNCSGNFIAEGEHDAATMVAWFPAVFPSRAARLAAAGIALVEVHPT